MSLWDWAGETWRRPGVAKALLTLQDDQKQCVPLLMWALWLCDDGRAPDPAAIDQAVALGRQLQTSLITPLREARRNASPAERQRLLADELEAEHRLLDRLEAISPVGSGRFESVQAVLATIAARGRYPAAAPVFDDLVGAIHIRGAAHVG